MTDRTVVLGGTGYVGSAVAAAFAGNTRSGQVVAVGRRARPAGGPVRSVSRDLSVPGTAADLVTGAGVVVHLVAPSDPTTSWRSGGDGAELRLLTEVLDAARGTAPDAAPPVVLVASTIPPSGASADERSDHERRKQALEDILLSAAQDGQVRTAALRLSTVYGWGAGGAGRGLVASLARRALRGEPLTVWRGAEVQRNLIHVDDVATAFVRAAAQAESGGAVWSVGGVDQLTVGEIAHLVADHAAAVTGRLVPVESVPPPSWAVPADFRDVLVDPVPFGRATGWRPAVPLDRGVGDLVTHVRTAA